MDPDSPLVATVIATAAVCADCIAVKVGLAVDEALVQVRGTVIVTSRVAPCDSCRKQTVVHQLG
jgi:hypothetical protein